jgi:hypothetical protein
MPIIPVFGRLRQEDGEFEFKASLATERDTISKKKKKKKRERESDLHTLGTECPPGPLSLKALLGGRGTFGR